MVLYNLIAGTANEAFVDSTAPVKKMVTPGQGFAHSCGPGQEFHRVYRCLR